MNKLSKRQKIGVAAAAVLAAGVCGGTAYYLLKNRADDTTVTVEAGVSATDFDNNTTALALKDGENTITAAGTYLVTGNISGSIKVNANGNVKLVLSNVSIKNTAGPAIYMEQAKNVYIELQGSNTLDATATTDLNGAIYAKDDLILSGSGSLSITSTIDGIVGKDDVQIDGGSYTIKADDDGIVGKDSLKITGGNYQITAGGLGLKTSNEEEKGDLEITGGEFNITATGKGVKSEGSLAISGGNLAINSTDDTIHSNGSVAITGGTLSLTSGDDGIHADDTVRIDDGTITIAKSYEGIEGNVIIINGGKISLSASDDGLNAAGGNDGSSMGGRPGQNNINATSNSRLEINGGELKVASVGDGLDSNGSIVMTGGTVYVDGPTSDGDGALDYDGTMEITGGTLVAVGSSGMAMNASSASQPSVLVNLSGSHSGTLEFGGISYTPSKSYTSVLISSPQLSVGQSYDLKINGTTVQSVTISDNITGSGMGGMMQGGPGGQMQGGPNGQGGGGMGGRR